ncbi:MAG: DUF2148 domain-containing protein [Actinomycetota bacterium]|nr:DUF2148 domain-containing protein [Actinomycetota bacterium]
MMYSGKQMEEKAVIDIASLMCAAARTAPKAKGIDNIITLVLSGDEKDALAKKMEEISIREDEGTASFPRDAKNIYSAQAVVLIGVKISYLGLKFCDYCGFENCEECKETGGRCAFSFIDLGIAIGSAVSVAASNRLDSRIMYSAGKAAMEMQYSGEQAVWIGIPISLSGKSIFFDRK